ncbi:hypothetical protein CJ030_MR2G027660 [Morella rubra]|uniref:GBF-interacting protein 1 N-terminal domain-containing protein n=1 Tax=Morella rubra TaxID=262757 RepID=A0A6A1WB35_9ROSI|nr:hypothetical protein CJ030_MR2G027660 [Morella rubra]
MVSGDSLVEGDGTQVQSIKEIVGNHSELDIYAALKETNMDPNKTAQKLLNQGGIFLFFAVSLSRKSCVSIFCCFAML